MMVAVDGRGGRKEMVTRRKRVYKLIYFWYREDCWFLERAWNRHGHVIQLRWIGTVGVLDVW